MRFIVRPVKINNKTILRRGTTTKKKKEISETFLSSARNATMILMINDAIFFPPLLFVQGVYNIEEVGLILYYYYY